MAKKFNKDGSPVKIKRVSRGIKYFKRRESTMVLSLLKDKIAAHPAGWRGFEARRDMALFEIGWNTGMRVEEFFEMTVEDVCEANRLPEAIVLRPEVYVVGKGSVERRIPVSAELGRVLMRYLHAKRNAGESLEPGAPMFCNVDGSRLAYRSLQSIVERRCVQAGLSEAKDGRVKARFSIHCLRHTFAVRWLAEHGTMAPAEAYTRLALIMGHDDIQTTQKYTRFDVMEAERVA